MIPLGVLGSGVCAKCATVGGSGGETCQGGGLEVKRVPVVEDMMWKRWRFRN